MLAYKEWALGEHIYSKTPSRLFWLCSRTSLLWVKDSSCNNLLQLHRQQEINIGNVWFKVLQVSAVFPTKKAFSSWAESQMPFKCITIRFRKNQGASMFSLFLWISSQLRQILIEDSVKTAAKLAEQVCETNAASTCQSKEFLKFLYWKRIRVIKPFYLSPLPNTALLPLPFIKGHLGIGLKFIHCFQDSSSSPD